MKSLKKTCIFCILSIQVFFRSILNAEEITHLTYSQFLKKFPDGYPEFVGEGNPKSIGAFKMYLESLGYMTFDYKGNYIGFRYYVTKKENKLSDKSNIPSGAEINAQDSASFQTQNNQVKSEYLTGNYTKNTLISKWAEEINNTIKKFIVYPKISKDRNQSGRVLISLSLDAKGNILNVNLKSSSGFSTLDKAAIKTINKIKSFRPAPFKNENQVHTFILPINYVLEN